MATTKYPNKIVVVDVEAICWEDGNPPPGQTTDIIEIGLTFITRLEDKLEITDPLQIKVRPTNSKISQYCTDLTGWTWKELRRNAVPFVDACKRLYKTGMKNCVFASWGRDENLFKSQCDREGIEYPYGNTILNIQNLFAIVHGLPKEVALEKAIEMMGLKFEGEQHRAVNDSYNTAEILGRLITPKEWW